MATQKTPLFPKTLTLGLVFLFLVSLSAFLYSNYQVGDSKWWQLLTSGVILAIPLALLYFSTGVLVTAAMQKRRLGQIDQRLAKIIYWAPRIAGVLIIVFVSLFALDVFEPGASLGEMLLAFLMHLLPSIGMAVVLALAWRWEWVGFVSFLAASAFFLRAVLQDPIQGLGLFLLFSGPMLVIALLFGLGWLWRQELHSAARQAKPGLAQGTRG